MRYGEEIISKFDVEKDLEIWENKNEKEYKIKITLPEFACLCPRSGYPDFATIYLEYIPNKFVVELKAIKLYINSFMNRNISHEDSICEIYSTLQKKLEPKFMKIIGDFNPRGNVHTLIEISSDDIKKDGNLVVKSYDNEEILDEIDKLSKKIDDLTKILNQKPKKNNKKEPFFKNDFSQKARVIKK